MLWHSFFVSFRKFIIYSSQVKIWLWSLAWSERLRSSCSWSCKERENQIDLNFFVFSILSFSSNATFCESTSVLSIELLRILSLQSDSAKIFETSVNEIRTKELMLIVCMTFRIDLTFRWACLLNKNNTFDHLIVLKIS
jgi:hypothetical protein